MNIMFVLILPYFLGYKTEVFSFQNSHKNLDLSYKMNLDLWDCNSYIIAKCHRIDLVICSRYIVGKTLSYSRINVVAWSDSFAEQLQEQSDLSLHCMY